MVLSNKMVILLVFWYLVGPSFLLYCVRSLPNDNPGKGSVSIGECSMKCSPLSERTPVFHVGNTPLPNQGFDCTVSSKDATNVCTLNIDRVFQKFPSKPVLSMFYFILICSSPLRVSFRLPKNFTKVDVISYLFVRGRCVLSARDLAAWGRATDLRVLYLKDGVSLLEDENQTASDLEGLFNVGTLALKGLSSQKIPHMFTSFVWEKMAEVQFSKMSLTSIPDVLKKTMPSLQSLELSHNNFREPPDFPWCNTSLELPRNLSRTAFGNEHYSQEATVEPRVYRRFFGIDFNPDFDVSKYEFTAGSLDRISLRGNGLQLINPTIFDRISKLQVIDLSQNQFQMIPDQIFRIASGLVNINLANNRLEFLAAKTFQGLRELRRLGLKNNVIRTLQSGLLNTLEKLEEINLKNNSLKSIESKALPFGSNSLKRMYLQQNYLHHIPKCAFYARNLEVFDMSDNAVDHRSLFNALDMLDVSAFLLSHSKSASSLDESYHRSLRTVTKKILKLERNNIEEFDVTQFNETRLRKFELILKAYTLKIGRNPLICDCKIRYLQLMLRNWTRNVEEIDIDEFESWICRTPEDLRGEKVLSVPQEKLKCETHYPKCPAQCECYIRSLGLPIFVDCRNRSLTEPPNELPDGSVELHLEYNQIQNLTFLEPLQNVTSLHVSHNRLRHISSNSHLPSKLSEIFLDSNKLTTLPKDFQTLDLSKINIQNNFFKCDCINKWMKIWLRRVNRVVVGRAQSVSCSSGKNQGKPLISVKDDDFICLSTNSQDGSVQKTNGYATAAYAVAGLLFLFIIVMVFLYRFRGELKLLLFTRLSWHPFDRVDDSDPSKIYDAFVSYSSRDAHWVMRTLREKLENEDPAYTLCVHDRDFLVGAPIFQNIFDSVKASRRMIMVLSNSFLQSEWCMMEFRAAHRKVLKDRTNYLIIVLYDDVDIKNLDDELKLYLRTNTYLSIDNRWFWQQLRYALPQKRLDTRQAGTAPEENIAYELETFS